MLKIWYRTRNWGHLSAVVPLDKIVEWLDHWKVNVIRIERLENE